MVLLKNEGGILPLQKGTRTIAVIGPNAASLSAIEGNYNAIPKEPVFPLDGIVAQFKDAKVLYSQGSAYADNVALPVPRTFLHPDMTSASEGLRAEYFAAASFAGKPVVTRVDKQIDFDWNAAKPTPETPAEAFAVRWTGAISLPEPGDYEFQMKLTNCYPCGDVEHFAVYLDDKQVTSFESKQAGSRPSATPRFTLTLPDTRRHALRIEYTHQAPLFGAGITFEWTPKPGMLQKDALAAAQKADVVLAFVGLSPELEGEEMPIHIEGFAGGDRTDIKLPAAQQEMLEAVATTGKPVIVVLLNGSALAVNWAKEHAAGILEAWYPGQAGGTAIAETLAGANNPAGRLPVTFYTGSEQLPAFDDYSMANRTYRYFKGQPLYGFGYGLSYSHFAYSNLRLSTSSLKAGETLTVDVDIANNGRQAGDEVAELYLTPPHTSLSPIQALAGFKRVNVPAGQTRHVTFALDPRTLSQVDERGDRAVNAGTYGLRIAGSQAEAAAAKADFVITGQQALPH